MVELIVVLHLIIWDANAGIQLGDEYIQIYRNKIPGVDLIEECRKDGVRLGLEAVSRWRRANKPNAFANVNCQWERRKESL